MTAFRDLVERQILKAEAEGQFDNLPGAGKPLPPRAAGGDSIEEAGFRIMAEAGAVPEEIGLRREIAAQKAQLAALADPAARKTAMAELARLELRHAIAMEARRKFLRP